MIFALVRAPTDGKKQKGISFLLIDMTSPGITVRPIINIAGAHELNEVLFEDVCVPKVNRIGAEKNGWSVAKYLLEFERFAMGSVEVRRSLDQVEALAKATPMRGAILWDGLDFRSKLSQLRIDTELLEASEQRVLAKLSAGEPPGPASSLLHVQNIETQQRADLLGVEVLGYYAAPYQPKALEVGANMPPIGPTEGLAFVPMYLSNRIKNIARGSSEIQRNIAAKVILGLWG
jgi:acyl-CoA dehydrogenase